MKIKTIKNFVLKNPGMIIFPLAILIGGYFQYLVKFPHFPLKVRGSQWFRGTQGGIERDELHEAATLSK